MNKRNQDAGDKKKQKRIPWWEWVTAAVGALLVLTMLGFMGYRALRDGPRVPALQVQTQATHARSDHYVVEIEVSNDADGGATGVVVEGELVDGGTVVETAQVTLDYVPARSRVEAGLLFTRDPAEHRLRLRAAGYQRP